MSLLSLTNKKSFVRPEYGFPRKTILFANVRDEANMREWCAHHLLLGFDKIYLFDHMSAVPLAPTLVNFGKRVVVKRCTMANPVKLPLMQLAADIAKRKGYDWMLYLDADEFLVLTRGSNIKTLLNAFSYADSVSFNWLWFGSNYHVRSPPGLVIEAYTRCDTALHPCVKSFVRPLEVKGVMNPHFYSIRDQRRMVNVDGSVMNPYRSGSFSEHSPKLPWQTTLGYIAHYHVQSEEVYRKRQMSRPRDDTGTAKDVMANIHGEHNDVENTFVRDKYAKAIHEATGYRLAANVLDA